MRTITEKLSAEELRKQAQEARVRSNHDRDESQRLLAEVRRIELAELELRAKEEAEDAAHSKRMFEEIGQSYGLNEAQHSIVYALAWNKGHSSGFAEVAEVSEYYEELAALVRKILDAR